MVLPHKITRSYTFFINCSTLYYYEYGSILTNIIKIFMPKTHLLNYILKYRSKLSGGESGIRTHGTLFTYTRFPSVRLKPLGHLSVKG